MQVQPYLFFEGRCEEAIEFYKKCLGAEVVRLNRFRDSPGPGMVPPEMGDKIMHADLKMGDSIVMLSDGRCTGLVTFGGFSLSFRAENNEQAEHAFTELAQGGSVDAPMVETFFASRFGMLRDRFGVHWMVIAEKQMP